MGRKEGAFREENHTRWAGTIIPPGVPPKPHPPILIGGGGEKKTLRLVAKYGDACNLFATPELEHKLDVLRQHCADVGRDYDEIEKTVMGPLDPGAKGEKVDELLESFARMAKLGITHFHGSVPDVADMTRLEVLATDVVPAAADI